MQIKQILVPTDFSENAQHAVSYAIELAKRCSAKLHLLHTSGDTDLPAHGPVL